MNERLTGVFLPISDSSSESLVETRLGQWREAVGGGRAGWERRLAWDNLHPEKLKPLLGAVQLADRQTLPAWAETLREILSTGQDAAKEQCGFLAASDPAPFEELLVPFVLWARQQLQEKQPFRSELFSSEAESDLERHLLANLCRVSSQAFLTEFKVFCTRRQILCLFQAAVPTGTGTEPGNQLYCAFVRQIRRENYATFFLEYSVLARMMVLLVENWVQVMGEFGERLRRDLAAIQHEFNNGQAPGLLIQAEAGLSDSHHNGRTVIKLKFDAGLRLVYKPKDLGLERAYNEMLGWLNASGELLPFKIIKVLNRPGYGWTEYVEQLPCDDQAALSRFYRRLGMLLGLIHLLNGTDCHYENLIASGEYPVLIDAETLLHPMVPYLGNPTGEDEAKTALMTQNMENSILRTAMLPLISSEVAEIDYSAFAAIEEQATNYHLPRWENINNDRMDVVYEKAKINPGQNVPKLEGVSLNLAEHAEDLSGGFEEMYRFMLSNRAELLSESGPLKKFADLGGRFLFRNTRVYGLLLHYSTQPCYLREGVERSFHFEKLSRAFLLDETKPNFWPLLALEKQDLEQLDIPMFGCNTSRKEMLLRDENMVSDWFLDCGYQAVLNRLQALDEADLCHQQTIIREALRSRFAGETFNFESFMLAPLPN